MPSPVPCCSSSPAVDAAIEIGFIGNNTDTLVMLTNKILDIMHRNDELINVRNSWGNKIPVWHPIYSQERAQPLGISRQSMAQSIQIGTNGMTLENTGRRPSTPILLKDKTIDSFRINDLRTLPYSALHAKQPLWNKSSAGSTSSTSSPM